MHDTGRMVDYDSRNAITLSPDPDNTVEAVWGELRAAQAALSHGGMNGSVVGAENAQHVADAYNALTNLTRWLPYVEGWCCGYFWGPNDRTFSCFSAHTSEEEALAWLEEWKRSEIRQGSDAWVVEYRATQIGDFRRPGADPKLVHG